MGWEDRHYNQGGQAGGFGGGLGGKSMVTILLIVNCVVFVLDMILTSGSRIPDWMSPYLMGRFTIDEALYKFQVWRVVTYQFLHADFMHILFNMIGLFFFGRLLEQWWGSKRFLAFYLMCGVAGVVPYTVIGLVAPNLILNADSPEAIAASGQIVRYVGLIGASGSVYGILVGCAVLFPKQRVQLLFPPIPMTMRTMALIFLGIAVFSVLAGTPNTGGELAHLGGAALGFFLVKRPSLLNYADRFSPEAIQAGVNRGRYERKAKKQQATREEVDRILAKVSERGIQSLTRREKKILQQDTDRLRNDQ
ncbi:MAG: rhomboid family intramembrane serine protease [Phycisphaeraceae bacterium]